MNTRNSAEPEAHDPLPPLRDMIRAAGISADKKFGQNFLLDMNITRKIARLAAIGPSDRVIEIGPGPGGLTRALCETGASFTAYEMDVRLLPLLEPLRTLYKDFDVRRQDALELDWDALLNGQKIVANLPYNIATVLIFQWLEVSWRRLSAIASMHLMVQAEVAERICAPLGGKTYGRLSVMCQWLMACRVVMHLPPDVFTPAPKVHSAVVEFIPRMSRLPAAYALMERIVKSAFNQRRKMIRSSLNTYAFDWDAIGIDPTLRAEQLSVDDYVRLSNAAST